MFEESFNSLAIKGTCFEMCPKSEQQMRKKTNRVHKLERFSEVVNEKSCLLMVKEYRRPAAGTEIYPCDLRSSQTLLFTTLHLINKVLTKESHSFLNKYYYIFDRLRAVQQDATTQCHHDNFTIDTLLITIRFLIYSSYRLCEDSDYDNNINNTLLNQCILTTINLIPDLLEVFMMNERIYKDARKDNKNKFSVGKDKIKVNDQKDEYGVMNVKYNTAEGSDDMKKLMKKFQDVNLHEKNIDITNWKGNSNNEHSNLIKVMVEVLAYHVLNNLHSPHAVVEALLWKDRLRVDKKNVLNTSIQLWLQHSNHNYHRCLQLSTRLPLLHLCLFNQHLKHIQTAYLQRLAHAFSSRNNHYNLPHMKSILHIPDSKISYPITSTNPSLPETKSFLSSFQGVTILNDKVFFDRKTFIPPHSLPTTTHPPIDLLLPNNTINLTSLLIP